MSSSLRQLFFLPSRLPWSSPVFLPFRFGVLPVSSLPLPSSAFLGVTHSKVVGWRAPFVPLPSSHGDGRVGVFFGLAYMYMICGRRGGCVCVEDGRASIHQCLFVCDVSRVRVCGSCVSRPAVRYVPCCNFLWDQAPRAAAAAAVRADAAAAVVATTTRTGSTCKRLRVIGRPHCTEPAGIKA